MELGMTDKLLDAMLQPISTDRPAGLELSSTEGFLKLRDQRQEEIAKELGEAIEDAGAPRWVEIAEEAEELLRSETKDLRVAAWLTDAWIRTEGFAGLRRGLGLVRGLQERFWDDVHPRIAGGDPSPRVGVLRGLSHPRFLLGIRRAPLTARSSAGGPLSFADRERLRTQAGKLADFEQAVRATAPAILTRTIDDLGGCLDELRLLGELITARYPDAELSLREPRILIEGCLDVIAPLHVPPAEAEASSAEAAPQAERGVPDAPPEAGPPRPAPGASRDTSSGPAVAPQREEAALTLGEAERLWRSGERSAALSLLQGAVHHAVNGRERFLRRLDLAEFCVAHGIPALCRPVLDDLEAVEQERGLRDWEHPEVYARLVEALIAVRMSVLAEPVNDQARQIFEALCRSDIARAYRSFNVLHEGA